MRSRGMKLATRRAGANFHRLRPRAHTAHFLRRRGGPTMDSVHGRRRGGGTMERGMSETSTVAAPPKRDGQGSGALELRDTRTGNSYSVPIIEEGVEGDTVIRGMDLRQVKRSKEEFG